MADVKATYPIAEKDMFLLWGLMGCLTPSDYAALIKSLSSSDAVEVQKESAYGIFWSKLTDMGLATVSNELNLTKQSGILTQTGNEAVTLSQVYLIAGAWPHHCAVICPEVIKILERYVEEGDTQSATKLGELYIKGRGVDRNTTTSYELFKKAADQQEPKGMLELGLVYLRGDAVKKDIEEGLNWISKSEALGSKEAMHILFLLHTGLLGVKEDLIKSVTYLDKAALAGHGDALHKLGLLYANGKLKPKDNLRAYIFLTLAISYFQDTSADRMRIAEKLIPIEWQIGDEIVTMCIQRKKIPVALL
jgi:TPR repeat protein